MLRLNIPLQELFGWFRRLRLWATGDWQLPHDKAPAHASLFMQFFLQNIKSTRWLSPCYCPDLVPCALLLFPKLKSPLKGKRFQTIDEIQENTTGQLVAIGRTVWGPKVPTLKEIDASLSCVQWFLYFASSSINYLFVGEGPQVPYGGIIFLEE